jgi:hypothetical protein
MNTMKRTTKKSTYRLTEEAQELISQFSLSLHITRTSVIELCIRKMAGWKPNDFRKFHEGIIPTGVDPNNVWELLHPINPPQPRKAVG